MVVGVEALRWRVELEPARAGVDQAFGFVGAGVVAPRIDHDEGDEHVRIPFGSVEQLIVGHRARSGAARAAAIDPPDGARDLALAVIRGGLIRGLATNAGALRRPGKGVVAGRPVCGANCRGVGRGTRVHVHVDGDQAVQVDG